MSSGLRIRAPQDPDYDLAGPYPDHLYLYTGRINVFQYAATRPLQWLPGQVGRYRNTDPVLVNYLVRLAIERRGEEDLVPAAGAVRQARHPDDGAGDGPLRELPRARLRPDVRARLGAARQSLPPERVWNGERVLPEGYVKFVSTVAPAWAADNRPIYGASSGSTGTRLSRSRRRRTTCPAPAARRPDCPVARPGRRAARSLQGQRGGLGELPEGAGASHGSRAPAILKARLKQLGLRQPAASPPTQVACASQLSKAAAEAPGVDDRRRFLSIRGRIGC